MNNEKLLTKKRTNISNIKHIVSHPIPKLKKNYELTNIKKKEIKYTPKYIIPVKPNFKISAYIIDNIDKFIFKNEPIGLIRIYRKKIVEQKLINKNELGIIKYTINNKIKDNNNINNNIYNNINNPLNLTLEKIISFYNNTDLIKKIKISNHLDNNNEYMTTLKTYYTSSLKEINNNYKNIFVTTNCVINIDILRYKAENNYYLNFNMLKEDIDYMFKYINDNLNNLINFEINNLINHNKNFLTFLYSSYLYFSYYELLSFFSVEKMNSLIYTDIDFMLNENKLPKFNGNDEYTPINKKYEILEDYFHIRPEETIKKIKTNITCNCMNFNENNLIDNKNLSTNNINNLDNNDNKCCCNNISALGPLSLEHSHWLSKCKCREKILNVIPKLVNVKIVKICNYITKNI